MSSGKFQFGSSFNVFVYFKRLFYKRKAPGVLVLNYVTFDLTFLEWLFENFANNDHRPKR